MPANRSGVRNGVLALTACSLAALFLLVYPVYVIRPFRYQDPRELAAALQILRARPTLDALSVLLAIGSCVWCWRKSEGRWLKSYAVICALSVAGFAALSRVNIYEIMFHPLPAASFSNAQTAKLDGDEEVLAINVGSTARAYPIRSMSYHHIVNDVVAGEPIVATY